MEPDKVEIVNLTITEEEDDDSALNFIGWF